MLRKIIKIDEKKCTGCGDCIPNCPEGALQIIDGKARLISDLFCDGLGACIGPCPVGAMTVEEREAEPYAEKKVMENIVKQGKNVIKAHLEHLKNHGETGYLKEAVAFLNERGVEVPMEKNKNTHAHSGCPGAKMVDLRNKSEAEEDGASVKAASQLKQWPIQLHLVNPEAPYYQKADVLLVADCVAYALGNFHNDYLKGKPIAIACPKLDENQEIYLEKIKSWFEDAKINTLTVMIMQVPCCRGLLNLAQTALEKSKRKVPVKYIVVGINGEIITEEWLSN
ncbi:MAG: 4Fe-4S binding protein [Candidatus Omnitrophica bacterium]|nr:4Fe-4S binding protein [Candidatus Omnitrophota bacterium]